MARPKGKIEEYIILTQRDLNKLSDSDLRGITRKLNDAANKRRKRLVESGNDIFSPSARAHEQEGHYTMPVMPDLRGLSDEERKQAEELYKNELKAAYLRARGFLSEKTSTITGTSELRGKYDEAYSRVLGAPLDDPMNLDKRYKKKKVLKKSVKKKIKDFWKKYNQWKEIMQKNNPDYFKGDTNLESVEEFAEEVYNQGKANVSDMEKKARRAYEENEEGYQEEQLSDERTRTKPVRVGKPNGRGKKKTKQRKYVTPKNQPKNQPKVRYEKVSVFDDF